VERCKAKFTSKFSLLLLRVKPNSLREAGEVVKMERYNKEILDLFINCSRNIHKVRVVSTARTQHKDFTVWTENDMATPMISKLK
jgi:hypothetical protein